MVMQLEQDGYEISVISTVAPACFLFSFFGDHRLGHDPPHPRGLQLAGNVERSASSGWTDPFLTEIRASLSHV